MTRRKGNKKMAKKTKYCLFCAHFNQEDASVCASCGLPFSEASGRPAVKTNEKKSRSRFALSQISVVDFLHLHLH
jgi:uncharacterized membrane protein YvbJ